MLREVEARVVREVSEEALFEQPILAFFRRLMLAAHAEVARPGRVPIDTGRLRTSLAPGGGVTEAAGSMADGFFARVGTNVRDYPRVLEESPRHLYRGGPSAGQPTAGWLARTVPGVEGEIPSLLGTLARAMEEVFGG